MAFLFQARSGGSEAAFASAKAAYDMLDDDAAALVWPRCLDTLATIPPPMPRQSNILPSDWNIVCYRQLKWLFKRLDADPQPLIAVLQGGGGPFASAPAPAEILEPGSVELEAELEQLQSNINTMEARHEHDLMVLATRLRDADTRSAEQQSTHLRDVEALDLSAVRERALQESIAGASAEAARKQAESDERERQMEVRIRDVEGRAQESSDQRVRDAEAREIQATADLRVAEGALGVKNGTIAEMEQVIRDARSASDAHTVALRRLEQELETKKQELDQLGSNTTNAVDVHRQEITALNGRLAAAEAARSAQLAEMQGLIAEKREFDRRLGESQRESAGNLALVRLASDTAKASVERSEKEAKQMHEASLGATREKLAAEARLLSAERKLTETETSGRARIEELESSMKSQVGALNQQVEAGMQKNNQLEARLRDMQFNHKFFTNMPEPKWIAMITSTTDQLTRVNDMLKHFARISRIDSLDKIRDLSKDAKGAGREAKKFGWFCKLGLDKNTFYVHSDVMRVLFKTPMVDEATNNALSSVFESIILPLCFCPASLFVLLYERRTDIIKPYLSKNIENMVFESGVARYAPTAHYTKWPFTGDDTALDFFPGSGKFDFGKFPQLWPDPTARTNEFVQPGPMGKSEFELSEEEEEDTEDYE